MKLETTVTLDKEDVYNALFSYLEKQNLSVSSEELKHELDSLSITTLCLHSSISSSQRDSATEEKEENLYQTSQKRPTIMVEIIPRVQETLIPVEIVNQPESLFLNLGVTEKPQRKVVVAKVIPRTDYCPIQVKQKVYEELHPEDYLPF